MQRSQIKRFAQWALALGCLGYILWYFTQNTDELKKILQLDISSLLIILLCFCIGQLITCWRFHLILERTSQIKIHFLKWIKLFILLRFFNQIMPQTGNIYSGYLLKKEYGVTYTQFIAGYFSLTWLHTCQNLIMGLILIAVLDPHFMIGPYKALFFIGFFTVIILIGPISAYFLLPSSGILPKPLHFIRNKSSEVLSSSIQQLKDVKFISKFIISGIFIYINNFLLFYVCFTSIGASVSFAPLAMFLVLLLLSNRIILTPGNVGFREVAFGFAGKYLHIGQAEGILVSIVIRIVGMTTIYLLGLLLGGYSLIKKRG